MKPIYKILIVFGIIIAVSLMIYFGWRAITAPPSPTEPSSDEEGIFPKTGEGVGINLKKLSDQPVFNFWVIPDTKNIFYLTLDGKVFNAKEDEDAPLSNQIINALNKATISPDNQKILASFGDPRQPQWGIFDLVDRIWRPLPSELVKATWGENSEQLVVVLKKENELTLAWADLIKTPPTYKTIITDFRFKDVDLLLKSPQELLITEKPSAFYNGQVWQLNPYNLSIDSLITPANGLILKWSVDKKAAFKFSSPDSFSILDENLLEIVPLFFKTLPDKCTAIGNAVYCFVPQAVPENITLPDDYFQKEFFSIDDLYSADLETSESKIIFKSGLGHSQFIDAIYPQYLDSKIYFINRYDNFLYELKLSR